jgi:hypothetical protein
MSSGYIFLGLWTKLGQLWSNFPQLAKLEVFHSSANHARSHGAEIVYLNCKLLAGLAQEYHESFLRTFRTHEPCFYSFATKTVRGTLAAVSLVYDSLLQRTTTYLQQWSSRLLWLGTCDSSFPHSYTHTKTRLNKFKLGLQFITKRINSFLLGKATFGTHCICPFSNLYTFIHSSIISI